MTFSNLIAQRSFEKLNYTTVSPPKPFRYNFAPNRKWFSRGFAIFHTIFYYKKNW